MERNAVGDTDEHDRDEGDEREKEISDLRDLNNRHNKMAFGEKSTSRRHKRPSPKTSREEEKEDCEGPGAGTPDKSGQASNRQPEEMLDKNGKKIENNITEEYVMKYLDTLQKP